MDDKVLDRLSRIRDEECDVVQGHRWAIEATRGSSERGLLQRMADHQVVIELREELKKREEGVLS